MLTYLKKKIYFNDIKQEAKILTPIIIPLMAAQLSYAAIGVIDSVMAGNVSSIDLAAVSVGSSVWFIISLFATGMLIAITPTIAQLRGAGKQEEIPSIIQQGFWLAIFLGATTFIILQNIHPFFIWIKTDPEIIPLAEKYIYAISWGIPILTISSVLRGYIEGIGHTRPIFIISLITLSINVVANYILIYGKFGFPKLGGPGCGWATSFSLLISLICTYLYVKKDRILAKIPIFNIELPNIKKIVALLKIGFPIGMAIFAEVSAFSMIAILISSTNSETVASHQIAMNIAGLLFMIPLSIGLGSTIRVGYNVGKKEHHQARITCITSIILSLVVAIFTSLFIYFFSYQISDLYSNEITVITYASHLLMYAALFQISDAAQVSFACSLRGYKDTAFPMCITILAYWVIAIPIGYILSMTNWIIEPMGPAGFWIGLVGGLSFTGILLGIRLHFTMQSQ